MSRRQIVSKDMKTHEVIEYLFTKSSERLRKYASTSSGKKMSWCVSNGRSDVRLEK